jgi:predicted metal-dependent HD superfamily phosphohydrolase
MDVLEAAERIGIASGISGTDLELLRVAAAYHDSGFLISHLDHEKVACDMVRAEISPLGYSTEELDTINGLIMATKIPQDPKSLLEEVLCDADLDYLGREDFGVISNTLYLEFLHLGIIEDRASWMRLQTNFFLSHHYWTKYSHENREPLKEINYQEIKSLGSI